MSLPGSLLERPMPRISVLGAGISGLLCARTLADHGFSVTVFEKSRGVGGRMATRRAEDGLQFDHGAQYFTVRDPRFRRYVESWKHDGIVKPWDGRIGVLEDGRFKEEKTGTVRFVAVPNMNAICRHLAIGQDIRLKTCVSEIRRTDDHWQLTRDDGGHLGEFDVVMVTAPPIQTAELLRGVPHLAHRARAVKMLGCWAVFMSVPQPLDLGFDGAFAHKSPLAWIARNCSKPARPDEPETWVLHASPEWSGEHMEKPQELVRGILLDEFWNAVGRQPSAVQFSAAHRWRFAIPPKPLDEMCLFDSQLRIGACGDWCAGPRVEGAFLSGFSAAERVLGLVNQI